MNEGKAVKSGIWFTASNFLVKGIGFITMPFFSRLLTKAEFGDFNNFTTWLNILLIVTSFNLESSLIRVRFDFEGHLDVYPLLQAGSKWRGWTHWTWSRYARIIRC